MLDAHARHKIEKVRNETRRRRVSVRTVEAITPSMLRVTFASPDLADFDSPSPDDHIKLFVPDRNAPEGIAARDYTPRAFDNSAQTLSVDFFVHDAGPASDWARKAKPGDEIAIGGPRGSTVVPDDFDHYLLVGDETALPAIGRRVEGLRAGVPVTTIILVDGPQDEQHFETKADWRPVWVHRKGEYAGDTVLLRAALDAWEPPAGDGYVFVAAEARAARVLKDYLIEERGQPKVWLRAAGYWVRGESGKSEKFAE